MSEPGTRGELILTEQRGHILVITINRPEARNAFDGATAAKMESVIDAFEQDPELRVAIIPEQMKIARPVTPSEDTREGLRAFAEKRAPV